MGNDYIDEIIDDMMLDGSETADEIKKANEKVTNRYQEMEMKNKANQNVVPFPDYRREKMASDHDKDDTCDVKKVWTKAGRYKGKMHRTDE